VDRLFAVEDRQARPLLRAPEGHPGAEDLPFAVPVPLLPHRHEGLLVGGPGAVVLPLRGVDPPQRPEGGADPVPGPELAPDREGLLEGVPRPVVAAQALIHLPEIAEGRGLHGPPARRSGQGHDLLEGS
jgi:hypothetical protein